MKKAALILHGGCTSFDSDDTYALQHQAEQKSAMENILKKGWTLVESGESALSVAEKVVNMLEDNPHFNAGIGAALNEQKEVELDASIMDGTSLSCGAVSGIKDYKNPVSIARKVMTETQCVYLSEKGAQEFAKNGGFTKFPRKEFVTDYQLHWWHIIRKSESERQKRMKGTVGVVVLDVNGNISAATSTGGLTYKMKGRVGDSPLIGCGTYADSRFGGVSLTGYGEQIIKTALAKYTIDLIRFKKYTAQQAAEESIRELSRLKNGKAGIITIDKNGTIGVYANEQFVNHAYMSSTMEQPFVGHTCVPVTVHSS